MRGIGLWAAALLAGILSAPAQNAIGDSKAATGGARPPQMNEGFIGRDLPAFDPGSEVVAYDGKLWNINNNRVFRARFEKYLNAPPATGEADVAYQETIDRILELLSPGNANKQNIDAAFGLLKKASAYRDDANLCRTMSDAIHAARASLQTIERIKRENVALERERKTAEWNNQMAARFNTLGLGGGGGNASAVREENMRIERDAKLATARRQLADVGQTIENNKLRIAMLEMATKGHLQALIMQYFATRRFEHVIIANRFYRAIYSDGDNSIDVYKKMVESLPANKDAGQAKVHAEFDPRVSAAQGMPAQDVGAGAGAGGGGTNVNVYNNVSPAAAGSSFSARGVKMGLENFGVESLTGGAAVAAQAISRLVSSLSQVDSLANEAIRDVNEGVEAYKFLLEQGELQSATERLQETFALGEYMPSVRLLPRADKRRALEFTQKGNELLAALEVNDLTRAEKLVGEIQGIAGDFDSSKPLAKIETAKTLSAMHLAKARNAAVSGDKAGMESELLAAAGIWPRNPALSEMGAAIFKQADIQQGAINDFDALLGQKNYRGIFEDKERFIAAAAVFPAKQKELKAVLERMADVEAAIVRAQEIASRGDTAGAWESAEGAYKEFPEDNKLNQLRADLTTQASEFVYAINKAGEMEKSGRPGSSLAWYLKAREKYPASRFARDGIGRVSAQVLPDAH
jgi:hypothetical protein